MCCQAIQKLFNKDVVGEVSLEVQELSLFLIIKYVVYDMLYFDDHRLMGIIVCGSP